ncbi:Ankyrin-2 like protein [Argiope bruennichi]|uniref:Ankyrin-2 like protein n=1 Tax=Argiope bruennichi TaxID=94029 RepID=A0A8T0EJW3_ARGBR|nr:Ankyrin-2 like protein [Argiope bruennichi]
MDYNDRLLHDLVISDNNIELLRKELAKGKDPNLTDSSGDTLLHIAAKGIYDNPGIVQELINAGADVCRLDASFSTPLHFAVICGKCKVVDLLLQTEISINQKNRHGITALHYAINKNASPIFSIRGLAVDMYIIKKLLDHRLINVDATDNYHQTPLMWAIKNDNLEIVKMLLKKNAIVDTSDSFRQTPLHHALFHCNHRIVVALLLKQANLLTMAGDGQTPLDIIIKSQSIEFACTCLKVIAFNYSLKELLTNKLIQFPELWQFLNKCWDEIDYMKSDIIANELTVFDFFSKSAAKPGFDNPILQIYKPVVEKLLTGNYPGSIQISDSSGETLLHIAAKSIYDNPGIVQELINAGADVCGLDRYFNTPLHFAVIYGKRKVVDLLLQTEVSINQKNQHGMTALHYAINKSSSPIFNIPGLAVDMYIIKKLLDHRLINVDATDSQHQTPLILAIKNDHLEIVKMLLNKNASLDTSASFGPSPLHHALFYRNQRIVVALLLKQANLFTMAEDCQNPLDIITNLESFEFACTCLKVIAFNYSYKELLTNKLIKFPELWQFLNKCWNEIDYMKSDIIANELTVFDFFSKCAAKPGFDDPILQIYKPVVEKLLTGNYPVYLSYILNRISKSTMYAVLEDYFKEKYCNKPFAMEYLAAFSKIIKIGLLCEYLSNENIFCLIVAFIDTTKSEYLLNFHEHEWYLTDLWDAYPDKHFC